MPLRAGGIRANKVKSGTLATIGCYVPLSHISKNIHEQKRCHKFINICMKTRLVSLVTTTNVFLFLRLKEGMYISWENPELNRQIKHVSATL